MATFEDTFEAYAYLCIQVVPLFTLANQTSFLLPNNERQLNEINNWGKGLTEVPLAYQTGLALNNQFTFNSVIPESLNLQIWDTNDDAGQIIFIQLEEELIPTTEYNNLLSLNYTTLTREQFLYFINTTLPAFLRNRRIWQMSKVQLAGLVANAGSDASTAVISISNLDDIVQSRPRQVFLYQVQSFSLPFSVLEPYWGIVPYDPATPPVVPVSIPTAPTLTALTLLTTQTSLTNGWLPASPPYYRLTARQVFVVSGSPVTVYSGNHPLYNVVTGFTLTTTGLTANTTYNGGGRVQLGEDSPSPATVFSPTVTMTQTTSP